VGQLDRAQTIARGILTEARVSGRLVQGRIGDVGIWFTVDGARWSVYAYAALLEVGAIHARSRLGRAWRHGALFDRSFTADASIASLLDAPLRARLVALAPHAIRVTTIGVWLEKRYAYYYAEDDDIVEAIVLTAELTRRVAARSAELEEQLRASVPAPGPFRKNADPEDIEDVLRARRAELRRLEGAPRARWPVWLALALLVTSAYALLH
jgi:hypothetical protein